MATDKHRLPNDHGNTTQQLDADSVLRPAQCFNKPEAHSCAGETRMTPLESEQNRFELKPKTDRTRFTIKPRIDPGSTHDLWGTNGDTPGDPAVEPSEGPPEGPPTNLQSVPRGTTNKNKHGTTITKKPRNGNNTRFPSKNPPEPSTCILLRTDVDHGTWRYHIIGAAGFATCPM
jgi:hypothetical protein